MDIDFEEYIDVPELFTSGRQRVIDYVIEKYGESKISQILAMGTMGTRSVLKDVGRSLGVDHNEINKVNKLIPNDSGLQWSLSDCLYGDKVHKREPVPEIVKFAEKYPTLMEAALEFEGMPRHTSVHAAGVIISPNDVVDILPLAVGGDGQVVSQFNKDLVEEIGCLKMDFLGLRTLGAMHKAVDLIKERHSIDVDVDAIPFDDLGVLKMLKDGHTDGVFQIESGGMTAIFREMNEVVFDDIIAILSIYRPGPMKYVPQYIARKNGFEETIYLFPELKQILESTYGIMVYQEQVILIAVELAGFSEGAGDNFRRGIGHKDEILIMEQINILVHGQEKSKDKEYIPGLVKNGIPLDKAKQLGEDIIDFAKYSFNKSHSAAYAVLTMQTGWFKYHYPLEYMTALISSFIQKTDAKIVQYIDEAKRMGIRILPPDINKSEYEFTIEDDSIRYGLGAIKGLNKSAIAIMLDRQKNGPYENLEDFSDRFAKRVVNKKAIDALALSGTFEPLSKEKDRLKILNEIYDLRGYNIKDIDEILDKYIGEKDGSSAKQMYSKNFAENLLVPMKVLLVERALLGMYLSSHPLDGKAEEINWETLSPNDTLDVVCIIKKKNVIKTKKGDDMAFLLVETLEGDRDITIFPNLYENCKNKLDEGGLREITINCQRGFRDPTELDFIARNIKYFRDIEEKEE